MHDAAARDDLSWVRFLLDHGADPQVTNHNGETAVDRAHDEQVVRMLRDAMRQTRDAGKGTPGDPQRATH